MLQSWQLFYATIATAAATLAGLLFLSLSLIRDHLDEVTRVVARRTFANLIDVLVLGLIFLIPHQTKMGLAVALVVFGLARFLATLVEAVRSIRLQGRTVYLQLAARQTGLPLLFSGGIAALGVAVQHQVAGALFWPVGIIVALLASASWNAWELLFKK